MMIRFLSRALIIALSVVAIFAQAAFAQKHQHRNAQISFTVIKDANGKPVRNAEIVLHPVDKDGHQKDEGVELKTHEDGKADIAGIPYGKMRIQVIAQGFRTYGADYDITQPNTEIIIKMQKPADQYSIYK